MSVTVVAAAAATVELETMIVSGPILVWSGFVLVGGLVSACEER
jgi:hypothetical protein